MHAEEFLATLDGSTDAEIRPRVSGIVESVDYKEGAVVGVGALLFTIDKRPFVAALIKAEGDYQNAVAQLNKARADVARFRPLVAERALSRQDLDNALAAAKTAAGLVQSMKGSLESARLNLQWTDVRSQIEGLAGIAQTRVGNLVGPNQVLAVVSTLDPIRVTINITQREYLEHAELYNQANEPQYANQRLFQLLLLESQVFPHAAREVIIGRQVDPTTGTLPVQLLFPNPGNVLRPGMFAKVRVRDSRPVQALVVPNRAVQQLQGRNEVAVVTEQGRVEIRNVQLGQLLPEHEYVVASGLRAGERVIVAGQQGLQPGTPVTVEAAPPEHPAAPDAGRAPTPPRRPREP